MPAILQRPAAPLVDRQLGVDQRPMLLEEPDHAVVPATFFVRRQRHDEIAVGHEALPPVADQIRHERRGHCLVVGGAAAVEVAVPLEQLEGIDRPVFPIRLDDVEMSQQQQRPPGPGAAQARHHVALARSRHQHLDVGGREPGGEQPASHRLRRLGVVADGVGRVDLDQLLIDLAQELLVRLERGRLRAGPGS